MREGKKKKKKGGRVFIFCSNSFPEKRFPLDGRRKGRGKESKASFSIPGFSYPCEEAGEEFGSEGERKKKKRKKGRGEMKKSEGMLSFPPCLFLGGGLVIWAEKRETKKKKGEVL